MLQAGDIQDQPVLGLHRDGDDPSLSSSPHLSQVGPHTAHFPLVLVQPGRPISSLCHAT